jgi:hypothetical protein
MKVMVEMDSIQVAMRILSEKGMMTVDRSLMESLRELHPDMMVYNAVEDAYYPISILEKVSVR